MSLVPYIKQGSHANRTPDEILEKTYWKERSKSITTGGKGRPSFWYRRQHEKKPATTMPGDIRVLHPNFDRFLTPREVARIMGIPDHFIFSGTLAARANLEAGRSVSPHTLQALLAQLEVFLERPDDRDHKSRADLSVLPTTGADEPEED